MIDIKKIALGCLLPIKALGSERTTKAFGIRGETLEKNSPLVQQWPPDRCHGRGKTEIQRGMKLGKERECDGGGFKSIQKLLLHISLDEIFTNE